MAMTWRQGAQSVSVMVISGLCHGFIVNYGGGEARTHNS
jgi:hypothetical protein